VDLHLAAVDAAIERCCCCICRLQQQHYKANKWTHDAKASWKCKSMNAAWEANVSEC
jgi:hypothetical protein